VWGYSGRRNSGNISGVLSTSDNETNGAALAAKTPTPTSKQATPLRRAAALNPVLQTQDHPRFETASVGFFSATAMGDITCRQNTSVDQMTPTDQNNNAAPAAHTKTVTSNPPKPPLPTKVFTVKETACILKISKISVYRLIQRGLLKASKALRKKMIPEFEIERFLRETSGAC
jgi:hypothetical protein